MCTVTILRCRLSDGEEAVRLACNRDEQRSRPAALPPRVRTVGGRSAVWPIDAAAGGAWVGASEAGFAMTLLNVTSTASPPKKGGGLSRGSIIPDLLHSETLASALSLASALDPTRYAPFRLVLVDAHDLAEVYSDGEQFRIAPPAALSAPRMFTSSGLGDDRVQGPRGELFREHFRGEPGVESQDAFHRHCWPDRPHLSVCMRRPDARTVSFTTVTLRPDRVSLVYHPDAPDAPAESYCIDLEHPERGRA